MRRALACLIVLTFAAACSDGARVVRDVGDIETPSEAIVVVYSHGTKRPQVREDCDADYNRVPDSLTGLQLPGLSILFLCSKATEDRTRPIGNYVYQRVGEIADTLDRLAARGVGPERIFLAGHSAGGWSSLMASVDHGDRFNGVIAFAPTFAGPRREIAKHPNWRRTAFPRQVARMTSAPRIDALVFAYENDPFNRAQELRFLAGQWPETVRLVSYGCGGHAHLTHLNDCREDETRRLIRTFIRSEMAGG